VRDLLGEHDGVVDVQAAEPVPVLMISAAQRAPAAAAAAAGRRGRRITVAVVEHVTVGARDVIGADRAAAEVDRRQVVVDEAEMGEVDVLVGDTLAATRQVVQTIVGHCHTHTRTVKDSLLIDWLSDQLINRLTDICDAHRSKSVSPSCLFQAT